jgi:multicomponent Na+:H+ antiporter subunit F
MSLETIAMGLIMPLLTLSILIAFIRMVRGPSLPDRVVALDLMPTMGIALITTYAIATDEAMFIDITLVVALISFLATIAFAYFVQWRIEQ